MTATVPLEPRRAGRLLGPAPAELILTVVSGEHQGREVRIRSAKVTIGAARGCTLRLAAKGVGPLHCWILRGSLGTIVRRRDARTRLNGRAFGDAPLAAGDRLRVGTVELEVSQCQPVLPDWTGHSTDLPSERAWLGGGADSTAVEAAAEAAQLRTELHALERRAAQQLGELNDLVRRVSTERDSLAQRVRAIESEVAGERDSLLLDRQQLELSLATREQELAQLRGRLQAREAEVESAIGEQRARAEQSQRRSEETERQRAALEAQLQEQTQSLRLECQSRQNDCDRLQAECQRLQSELAQQRELVGYTTAERDNLTVILDGRQRSEIDQQQTLQQRLDQTEQEKNALADRLSQQSEAWHAERESLRHQTERVTDHCKQVEGQLTHVRELVEALAAERDSLCQQLEAAELRFTEEEQKRQSQRASSDEALPAAGQSELQARLEAEIAKSQEWQRRAEESEQERKSAGLQLGEAAERFAALQSESEGRLRDASGRAEQLAQEIEETRQRLSTTQAALADAETRLHAFRTEVEVRQNADQQRNVQAEERADSLARDLAAADVRLADAERRLSAFRTEGDARVHDHSQRAAELKRQLEEQRGQIAALCEQLAASESRGAAAQTDSTSIDAERTRWENQRLALVQRVDELEEELRQHKQFSQGMTVGSEALAELKAQLKAESQPEDGNQPQSSGQSQRSAELAAQVASLQEQLQQAAAWQRQYEDAERKGTELRERHEQQSEEIERLKQQLTAAQERPAGNAPPAEPAGSQLAELQGLHDQQQWALADERQTLADQRQLLAEEREFLAAAQQELTGQRDEFARSQAEFEKQWREREEELQARQQRIDASAAELAERPQPTSAPAEEQSSAHAQEIEQLRAELAQRQAACEAQLAELELLRTAAVAALQGPRPASAESSPRAATSGSADSGGRAVTPGGTALEQTAPEVPEHFAAQFAGGSTAKSDTKPVWTQPDAPSPPADDDSIEAYMSRLLRRVGGTTSLPPAPAPVLAAPAPVAAAPAAAPASAPTVAPAGAPTIEPVAAAEAVVEEPVSMTMDVPIVPVKPEEFRPRNKAPELTTNMAAMRDLANSAARNAIVKHERHSGGKLALAQSIGAILTGACSIVLCYLAYRTQTMAALVGTAVAVVAACYWTSKTLRHAWLALFLRVKPTRALAFAPEAPSAPEVSQVIADAEPVAPDAPALADPMAADATAGAVEPAAATPQESGESVQESITADSSPVAGQAGGSGLESATSQQDGS